MNEYKGPPIDDDSYLGHPEFRGSDVVLVARDAAFVTAQDHFKQMAEGEYNRDNLSAAFDRMRRAIVERTDLTQVDQLRMAYDYTMEAERIATANSDFEAAQTFTRTAGDYQVGLHELLGEDF